LAIRLLDSWHATAVLKMNGKPFGTARGTLSADGKTLTIEDDYNHRRPTAAASIVLRPERRGQSPIVRSVVGGRT
jgi:hypothetical protein